MSPVWVKLAGFAVSKHIQTPDIATFHTKVYTPGYGAPEAMGLTLDSGSPVYTNSIDIWSLGCVIYELLVGARLFVSEVQVSRYYFGIRPFPEDSLRELSPPIDDGGISLLKSMLSIQPEDRPTAAEALNHVGLAGLKSGGEHGAQSDLVERYRLDIELFQDHVIHTRYMGEAENGNMEIEEYWSNCGELGKGGFSVVYKQIQKTTGQYRAVKAIDKGPPLRPDYSKELLAMAKLAKVCVLAPEEICSSLLPLRGYLVML